ncbi:hypothetical protein AKJ37_03015 [candidate division MSBL1 archaeon SCGC-AAA259I09]|uniref:Nitroreductase domain-containing protein n=4 Tax=candidate division MSBL1 TaxID=215777 RepID=A0A133UP08_9EURY|nr:hypothetical protein AKJ62_02125 [candidate division MSBL1 archaeon SCGC-AAA259D14]KXA93817.1 hypothetical protein AKJ66_00920 [candidate division MSBL1 archaeon SCGC-AAA259E22]KXA95958.1 hypothetical protein AKJ38_04175 [candidate division MSBL1 archaeon SCGC-AAA259I14]KXA97407.1 hypothetical protein AKJ37_03015 [candidate division MSBL1 archaeon SCGC-AAA259I09]
MVNSVLRAIRNRRTIKTFRSDADVGEENIQEILEAGRWAPSMVNSQPWRFVVIEDEEVREQVSEIDFPIFLKKGLREAPVVIVVCADTEEDPKHYVEDCAVATQNIALAAQSLSLGSAWIGVHGERAEKDLSNLLDLPERFRPVSILCVGVPKDIPESERKDISELVYRRVD